MSANRKIILIIILGASACLLSFGLSQYFSKKNRDNQVLLSQIQQISGRVEHIRLLSKTFIQNGDPANWLKIMDNLEFVRFDLGAAPRARHQWEQELKNLKNCLAAYHHILTRIHDPAVQLRAEKAKLQGIGFSFAMEVEEHIITPYRKDEGLRTYKGDPIDPFKTRIKDTAHDLIRLHIQQQLILLQLMLDWNLPGYQRKKQDIAKALEKRKSQLAYMNVLMGNEPDIKNTLDSIDRKLTDLVRHEQVILDRFAALITLNGNLVTEGDRLLTASEKLSARIVSDTTNANRLNGLLSWGLLITILGGLGLLGTMLASDIIHFVEDLKMSRENHKASENDLKVTLNSIGDGVIATDARGVITRMNPSAEQLTGWPSTEGVGRNLPEVLQIVNAHTRKVVPNPAEKVLAEGMVIGLADHTVLIARKGQEYQIADSGAPIRDMDGRIVGVILVFRDVTESYCQEQKIRDNEKLLKELTANVPGVVYQFKATRGHFYSNTFVSEKASEIFGLEANPQTFFNKFYDQIPDDEKKRFITSVREAVDRVLPWHYEGRFIKPDGKKIWFSGRSIPHKAGDTVIFYGVLMDITRRKQLEASLRLTQFCFEKASIGIFRFGEEGRIIKVNEQACRSLGYSNDELCSMTVFDIDPTFSPRVWPEHIEKLRKSGTLTIETLHRHKNGNVFPVQILINLMVFEDHEFHVAYVQDITERRQWQNNLEASERRYRDLFNQAPVMYVITENRGGKPYIVDVNDLFIEVLGCDRQSVLGTPLTDFYTQDSCRELFDQGGYQRALNGQFAAEERSFVTRDGRIVHTLLHALPEKDDHGRIVGTRAMYLDITARKQAEQETKRLEAALLQAQKMEAIGTLAGGIAHDFNNILSAVVGYAQISLNETDQKSRLHYYLKQIYAAGMRASDLVRQILAFSRQAKQDPKPMQVGPLIKEALKLMRSSLPATIEITQKINADTDNVRADPTQIHQIIMNLCTNAAQSMEETGGQMTISLEQVHLNTKNLQHHPDLKDGDYIKLSVQDTGHGISPELIEMIFNPYFTTKESGKGTGLGLSVVHGIVKSYDGGIYVHSKPNQGTTFEVFLPAIKKQAILEQKENATLPTGNETILLVDDEPILVEVGQQTLKMLGYNVLACNDSLEALNLFNRAPGEIDLVISDVTMPKMTGDILAVRMRQTRPDLPIILCTGFSSKLSDQKIAEIGVKALAFKPLVAEKLAALIRKILDKARNPD